MELRDIADGLVLGTNKFQFKDLDYPTQEGNHNELDQKSFGLQRERKTQQLNVGLHKIVCVELGGYIGVFTFHNGEQVEFDKEMRAAQLRVDTINGLAIEVNRSEMLGDDEDLNFHYLKLQGTANSESVSNFAPVAQTLAAADLSQPMSFLPTAIQEVQATQQLEEEPIPEPAQLDPITIMGQLRVFYSVRVEANSLSYCYIFETAETKVQILNRMWQIVQ